MKCKLCGAVFEDENLFFCTGCGAMLRNPATGEDIPENRGENDPESPPLAESQENTNDSIEEVQTTEKVTEPPLVSEETIDEAVPEPNEAPVTENVAADTVQTAEIPPNELYIVQERERAVAPEPPQIPEPEPQFVSQEAPIKPIKVGIARLTGAAVIALFAVIVLITVSVLFSLKLGLSADRLHDSVENMDIWSVINAEIGDMSVSDSLYYEVDFDKATHDFADKTEFSLYLAKTDFLSFSAGKVKEYADYILNGNGSDPTVSNDEMVEFFKNNGSLAKEVFGYEMQTADYNSIRSSLAKHETADKLSVGKIGWELRFRLENIKYILSYLTLGILAAMFIVLLIWIALTVNRKGRHLLGFYGNVFLWSGFLTLFIGAAASAGAAIAYIITGEFVYYLCVSLLLPTAVYVICFGVIFLIAGLILKKVKKSLKIKSKLAELRNSDSLSTN